MKIALGLLALTFLCAAASGKPVIAQASMPPASAAASTKRIAFDVVSIKPNQSGSRVILDLDPPPDGLAVANMPLRMLISKAFGIREDLISGGPSWVDTDHYDLTAKVAGEDLTAWKALSRNQRDRMLQSVLSERFHLVAHTLTKDLPGYTLTVAKNGPRLELAKPEQRTGYGANPGDFKCEAVSIPTLAELLSGHLHQSVVDQTDLIGKYTFELKWEHPRTIAVADRQGSDPSGLPELPTALEEQLGLKLTPTKVPSTILVIDSAQKPTPN